MNRQSLKTGSSQPEEPQKPTAKVVPPSAPEAQPQAVSNGQTRRVKVEDLKEGDLVDLSSCPFLKNHPSAEFEYATVGFVEEETPNCILVGYDGIDHVGYPKGTELLVADRPVEDEERADAGAAHDLQGYGGDVSALREPIKVDLEWIGEGRSGDYNAGDPSDKALMRFTVYGRPSLYDLGGDLESGYEGAEWVPFENGSCCTQIPATLPKEALQALADRLLDQVFIKATSGHSIKKLCERLSWMGEGGLPSDEVES